MLGFRKGFKTVKAFDSEAAHLGAGGVNFFVTFLFIQKAVSCHR
jgi:hypothetical protein